jgi:Pin2-interacting protein X1
LAKEQKSREDLRRAIYTERRWGKIRFVKGGFLIGDKIQELVENEANRMLKLAGERSGRATPSETGLSERLEFQTSSESSVTKSKKSKKKKDRLERSSGELPSENVSSAARIAGDSDQTPTEQQDNTSQVSIARPEKLKKRKWKIEKLAEQPRRDPAKSKKRRREKTEEDLTAIAATVKHITKKPKRLKADKISSELSHPKAPLQEQAQLSLPSTPVTENPTKPHPSLSGGRHAVRSRFIAQKRLAVLDTASLNEVSFDLEVSLPLD